VQSIISPAVAEKLIKDKKIIDAWVVRPKSEKLVLDSDKRPAIDPGAELETIDTTPEREPIKLSPTMGLITLGELEELGTLDEALELFEAVDLGLETEETEEIEL
jgi:hypothetical protein